MKFLASVMSIKAREIVSIVEDYEKVEKGFQRELEKDKLLSEIALMYTYMKRLKLAIGKFKGVDPEIPDDIAIEEDEAISNEHS